MLICKLQNLDAETLREIFEGAPIDNSVTNGMEVAVICIACEAGNIPEHCYFDVVLPDFTIINALSGYHLAGIGNWK